MWYQTLLVVTVISCLKAVVGEEDTVSPSTQYFIARAQCEAQCYKVEDERNGSKIEREDAGEHRNSRITECLNGLHIEVSSGHECRRICNNSKDCVKSCSCLSELRSSPVRKSAVGRSGPSAPQLHCREATMLSVVWECSGKPVFFLLYRSREDSEWRPWNTTLKKLATLRDLTQNALYQFRVLAILQDGQLGNASTSDWISTLNDTFNPGPVSGIRVANTTLGPDGVSLQTTISWQPARDRTCFYEVVCFYNESYNTNIHIEEPEKFQYIWDSQNFGTSYSIAIMGKNKDQTRESNKAWLNFTTPDCFFYYQNNVTKCVPPKPEDVSVEVKHVMLSKYDVTVSWAKPVLQPSYFLVEFKGNDYDDDYDNEARIVNGDSTSVTFTSLNLSRKIKVSIAARSRGIWSAAATITVNVTSHLPPSYPDKSWNEATILLVILLPAVIFCVARFCIYFLHCNGKLFSRGQERQVIETVRQAPPTGTVISSCVKSELFFDAKWEIPINNLLLGDVLGEGFFGVVRRGVLQKGGKLHDVAVKMLRDDSTLEVERQFRQEIDLLQSVGRHPHIVSLIGYCTRTGRLRLVVEFCAHGDLLNFLRKKCKKMAKTAGRKSAACNSSNKENLSEHVKYSELQWMENTGDGVSDNQYPAAVETRRCEITNGDEVPDNQYPAVMETQMCEITNGVDEKMSQQQTEQLSPADLLSFARQSAMGMEYLANNHVVHRDLAARNVLVCADRTVKISDFGISRDVYESNVYYKKGSGALPVKWMAPESIWKQKYTTKSDVWSFGILVWEIVTFGGSPYPGIPTEKLYEFLREGHRMRCPPNCSKELYNVMLACWEANPKRRPTFTELYRKLDDLLEASSPQEYLEVTQLED